MKDMQTTASSETSAQGWHTAQWGTWGWLETIVKCIAFLVGAAGLINPLPGVFMLIGNPHLAALIVLTLLTLFAAGQVTVRFNQRETISFGFAIIHFLGNVAILIEVAQVPHHNLWPVLFGVIYVVGQLLKLQFLRTSAYTELGMDRPIMLRIASLIAGLYVLFTVLMLFA
jgi:hypothetical protein